MLEALLKPKISKIDTPFLSQIDGYIHDNTSFLTTLEKWRKIQIQYVKKLEKLQTQIQDRLERNATKSDKLLQKLIQINHANHNLLINKFSSDIFITNFEACKKIIEGQKNILKIQTNLQKEIVIKKEAVEKMMGKKMKLKKYMEEEMMEHIFGNDQMESNNGKKMKRMGKLKKIMKEQDQYQLEVNEVKEEFENIVQKSRENLHRFYNISQQLNNNRNDLVKNVKQHISNYAKNLFHSLEKLNQNMLNLGHIQGAKLATKNFIQMENQMINKLVNQNTGYLQATLKMIYNKTIDDMTEYSKDNEMKKKIKKTLESDCIEPEETDQLTRQIKLVKKILKNKDSSSMTQFKNIVSKNSKYRMNCVFILQMYRLNNKFEISGSQIRPMIVLINELLQICHTQNDAFALKQLMVLLMTYYVLDSKKQNKIYILHFFKKHELWRNLELWESILIILIYLQKKSTIRNMLVSPTSNLLINRNQLFKAERNAILNQILYIVRNMLLFDFSEREVIEFVDKFAKILKHDDKLFRDVHSSIKIAVKEEEEQNRSLQNYQKVISDIVEFQFQDLSKNGENKMKEYEQIN